MYNRVAGFHTVCDAFVTMTRYAGQEAFMQPMDTIVGAYMSLQHVNNGVCQCVQEWKALHYYARTVDFTAHYLANYQTSGP